MNTKNNWILSKLENVELEGIDLEDYPDFSDAHISYAEVVIDEETSETRPLTDDEIDEVNEQCQDEIYEAVLASVF